VKLVEFTISLPVESASELDAIARKINRKIEDVASLLLANAIRQRVQEMASERD
jgi:predicted transcriptional regulator